jgi:anti-sigma B factor antagonist
MRQLATLTTETHDDVVLGRIEGEVDMSNADALATRLLGLLTNQSVALVVDLSPTTYLDSSGIRLLFGLADDLRRRQQQLHVVLPEDSPIRRVLTLTGVDQAIPTHPTAAAALAAASSA